MQTNIIKATALSKVFKLKRKKMNFRNQLNEDISLIQKDWDYLSRYIKKREYAFNYWVLSRLYNIDE